ncbi:hypothetical protein KKF84_18685 [Myxococcota bacterium]|nr:hypothetical protein [Myxococcota bacterium]MBU1537349.1 hypothetical protein [Myxococcota bacterium]
MKISLSATPLETPHSIIPHKTPVTTTPPAINPKVAPSFGPLMFKSFGENLLRQEAELSTWQSKLQGGYTPSAREILRVQSLIFSVSQRVELVSKLVSALQSTLNTLKQTPM